MRKLAQTGGQLQVLEFRLQKLSGTKDLSSYCHSKEESWCQGDRRNSIQIIHKCFCFVLFLRDSLTILPKTLFVKSKLAQDLGSLCLSLLNAVITCVLSATLHFFSQTCFGFLVLIHYVVWALTTLSLFQFQSCQPLKQGLKLVRSCVYHSETLESLG